MEEKADGIRPPGLTEVPHSISHIAHAPFSTRIEDGITPEYDDVLLVSNEPSLVEVTHQYTQNCKGVGIGVGLDQMLNFAVNSQLERVYIVDNQVEVPLVTQAILEVASILRKVGEEVTPEKLLSHFFYDYDDSEDKSNPLGKLEQILMKSDVIDKGYREKLLQMLRPFYASMSKKIYDYLRYQKDCVPQSWIASTENIGKIIDMYDRGNIIIYAADLAGEDVMKQRIPEQLQQAGQTVGLIYLSNAMQYIQQAGKVAPFEQNLLNLPRSNDCTIIQTFPDHQSTTLTARRIPETLQGYNHYSARDVVPMVYVIRQDIDRFCATPQVSIADRKTPQAAGLKSRYGSGIFNRKERYVDEGVIFIRK